MSTKTRILEESELFKDDITNREPWRIRVLFNAHNLYYGHSGFFFIRMPSACTKVERLAIDHFQINSLQLCWRNCNAIAGVEFLLLQPRRPSGLKNDRKEIKIPETSMPVHWYLKSSIGLFFATNWRQYNRPGALLNYHGIYQYDNRQYRFKFINSQPTWTIIWARAIAHITTLFHQCFCFESSFKKKIPNTSDKPKIFR